MVIHQVVVPVPTIQYDTAPLGESKKKEQVRKECNSGQYKLEATGELSERLRVAHMVAAEQGWAYKSTEVGGWFVILTFDNGVEFKPPSNTTGDR